MSNNQMHRVRRGKNSFFHIEPEELHEIMYYVDLLKEEGIGTKITADRILILNLILMILINHDFGAM